MTHSVSASNLQQQAQVTQASISKSAYDSLAPLDLPSKPILYGQENHQKAELELSQINLLGTEQQTAAKIEVSNLFMNIYKALNFYFYELTFRIHAKTKKPS